jgi:hypothetical protein
MTRELYKWLASQGDTGRQLTLNSKKYGKSLFIILAACGNGRMFG